MAEAWTSRIIALLAIIFLFYVSHNFYTTYKSSQQAKSRHTTAPDTRVTSPSLVYTANKS